MTTTILKPQTDSWGNKGKEKRLADTCYFNRPHRWSDAVQYPKKEESVVKTAVTIRRTGLVVTSPLLNAEVLNLLLSEEVSALRITGFYPTQIAHRLGKWILKHKDRAVYGQNAVDPNTGEITYTDYHVDRVGFPRNSLLGESPDSPQWQQYFEKGKEVTDSIRSLTRNRHPIELLIKQLNGIWQHGAELEKYNGRELTPGIGRVTRPGQKTLLEKLPHVDGPWPCKLHFGVNVYLYVPGVGGELETFGGPTLSVDEMNEVTVDRDFRKERTDSEFVKPSVGDLIIVNTRRPHAVKGFSDGKRVSMSSFMMYDPGSPLRLYS
jgi:hypothetical protein